MTPEELYKKDRLMRYSHESLKEMRVKSLSWMLDCYRRGTIRRNTIINLIPLQNLYSLLKDMEERERYEDCAVIKSVIDEIYEQNINFNVMSKKRRNEIIGLLENTINTEKQKVGGGNSDLIEALTRKLNTIKEWTPKEK
jgi:hypothetical protein